MDKWKSMWAVIKGERLSAQKALNRNAGIGLFFLVMALVSLVMGSGKVQFTPYAVIYFSIVLFFCYSWLVGRNDEILRNKLLVIQGIVGLLSVLIAGVWFIDVLHSSAHPGPGVEGFKGRIGYAPGIAAGAFFYFGRHISDFSKTFKVELNKYTGVLLAIGIVLEVIIIVKFIEAVTVLFSRF